MTEKNEIPIDLKRLCRAWKEKYIKGDKKWDRRVNNPFIAIETHINEDTITDLLAHILQTDKTIKMEFINFLLKKEKINEDVAKKTEIEWHGPHGDFSYWRSATHA